MKQSPAKAQENAPTLRCKNFDAVLEARRIKAHGALRRQKQYIGKLMGRIDPEPIREALERLRRNS
jgi:ribosome-associated protein